MSVRVLVLVLVLVRAVQKDSTIPYVRYCDCRERMCVIPPAVQCGDVRKLNTKSTLHMVVPRRWEEGSVLGKHVLVLPPFRLAKGCQMHPVESAGSASQEQGVHDVVGKVETIVLMVLPCSMSHSAFGQTCVSQCACMFSLEWIR